MGSCRDPTGAHLGVEVEPLQRVDDQRVLRQPVVHDGVQALQEGRRLDHRLVVGVVEALGRAERGRPCSAASRQRGGAGERQATPSPAVSSQRRNSLTDKLPGEETMGSWRFFPFILSEACQPESQPTVMSQRDSLIPLPSQGPSTGQARRMGRPHQQM